MAQIRLVILILLLLPMAHNASFGYRFLVPETAADVSGRYVNAMLRDRLGFMWIATDDGLRRSDGYKAVEYAITDSAGRADRVTMIEEDGAGQIWITTYNGIYAYDCGIDSITAINAADRLSRIGIYGRKADFVDIDSEKGLWCSVGDTLYYYSFKEKRLQSIEIHARPLCVDCRYGRGIVLFDDGNLTELNWHTRKFTPLMQLEQFPFSEFRLYIDTLLRLWVFDRMALGGVCLPLNGGKPHDIDYGSLVKGIAEDDEGNVWLGTNSDGIHIIGRNGDDVKITADRETVYGLTGNHINSLYNDGHGLMWIGTSKNGLAYTMLDETSVKVCRTAKHEDICCFQEDYLGRLWIGYDGKGIAVYDSTGVMLRSFSTLEGSLPSDLVVGAYKEPDSGRLWFGSYGGGVFSIDEESGDISRIGHEVLAYTRHIATDSRGRLWAGTFSAGLHCCDLAGDSIVASMNHGNSCLKTDCITGLCYDDGCGLLYVATSTGLYVADTGSMTVECANDQAGELQHLPVTCLLLDRRGLLWVGGNSGMAVYDRSFNLHCKLNEADGLSDNRILGLTEDRNGNVWASTGRGISSIIIDSIAPGEYSFNAFPYYAEDGFGKTSFNKYSIYCTRHGDVLAGGTGEYVKIDPNRVGASQFGKVVFTGLQVDFSEVSASDGSQIIDKPIPLCEKITVRHGANVVLEVSAMNHRYSHRLRYVYRLDGAGRWVEAAGNKICLNDMEHGLHLLEVKVAGGGDTSKLAINVEKPFWLSELAMAIYLLLPWLAAWTAYRWYKKRKTGQVPAEPQAATPVAENNAYAQFIDKATAIVAANIDNAEFSVEDFGIQMGMSRSNLYKKMVQAVGKSPIDFIRDIRLRRGKELLADSSLGISQIAYSIGLSPKQFSKLFKEEYGCLPSQYRKRAGGDAPVWPGITKSICRDEADACHHFSR